MSASQGWVYCMISSSMEGLIKIGASTNHPLERARQLSASTSAATPFVLVYHKHVDFPFRVEAILHKKFDAYRVNNSREFFKLPLHKIIEEFDRFDETRETQWPAAELEPTPWAELFATFDDDNSARELTEDERFKCRQLEHKLGRGH